MTENLTHIAPDGRPRMVDIGAKPVTERTAVATGRLCASPATIDLLRGEDRMTSKGDPVAIAELAGIMGAKQTADLIPLCHPLALTSVKLEISVPPGAKAAVVTAMVKTSGKTGVEMEALTAVSVACLTLYDMLKAIDKTMMIEGIELVEKSGGTSGNFRKDAP